MLTPTVTEEEALWLYIGELPECRDRRGQVADWYQDREGEVGCKECENAVATDHEWFPDECHRCHGTGTVSNGNAEMAEALRATCEKVPWTGDNLRWSWWLVFANGTKPDCLDKRLFEALPDGSRESGVLPQFCAYPTAHAAIRDLCRAWVKLHKGVTL